ncbi:MAG TPA: ABC transporter permease [Xanthomonadales bacterium]|nr:ABC transporter permease [Xanthomonadales bacterium]
MEQLRLGLRVVRRAPGYAITAIVVLALGVGATATVYGVLQGVVLNPLPYRDADRIVRVVESKLPEFPRFSVSPGNYSSWQKAAKSFDAMAAYSGGSYNLTGRDEPVRLRGMTVTPRFFDVLGVAAAAGRTISEGDAPGDAQPVVLSHRTWMTHFGGNAEVIGQAVTLNDKSYTIAGVMPARFDFPSPDIDLWTLWRVTAEEASQHGGHYIGVIARLAPGVAAESAHAELDGIAAQLEQALPDSNQGWRTIVQPLPDVMFGDARTRLLMLLGGVGLVLLISGANVASLTVVRATARLQEFAVRRAQGATSWHVARQLLAEGVALSTIGGLVGVLLAAMALPAVRAMAPEGIPRIDQVSLDWRIAAFAVAMSLVVGVLASLLPTWFAARRTVALDLREGGRGTLGSGRARSRAALVVAEVALATVLLVGAGLLGRSLLKLTGVDPGFRAEGAVLTYLALPDARYADDAARLGFYQQLVERVGALPGVEAAGVTQSFPIVSDYVLSLEIQGRPAPAAGDEPSANYYAVSPGYFAASGVPVLRGRNFNDADRSDSPPVMLVSSAFAAKHFPDGDALGQHVKVGNGRDQWYEIVGLVGDVRQYGLAEDVSAQMYVPMTQDPFDSMRLVARVSGDPAGYAKAITAAVLAIDDDQPVGQVMTLSEVVADSLATQRFSVLLVLTFAVSALALAAVGLYGTIAYTVSQATQEIGIRKALGAQAGILLRQVLAGGVKLGAIGLAIGVALSLAAGRAIQGFLYGVRPYDPLVLAGVALLLLGVAALATLVPAFRASRIDPMVALRHE